MRLINAENLLKNVEDIFGDSENEGQKIMNGFLKGIIKEIIDRQPTVEAEEIKHSHWEEEKTGKGLYDYEFICHNCKGRVSGQSFPISPDNCPYCRAKMDGKEE